MSDKKELIEQLETLTIQELIDKITSGEATAAHLSVARGLLNDNKVLLLMHGSADRSNISALAEALPFTQDLEGPSEAHG